MSKEENWGLWATRGAEMVRGRTVALGAGMAARLEERIAEPLHGVRRLLQGEGHVEGLEHLPEQGPVIVVANHRHRLDATVVLAHLPRPGHVVDVGRLEPAVLARRAGEQPRRDAWQRALGVLAAGEILVLFPEGIHSPDQAVHKGRTSVGWLVLATQWMEAVPVVPLALDTRQGTLRFGAPLSFMRHAHTAADRTIARGVTDEVMSALVDLIGARYVDSHTTTARAQLRSAGRRRRDQLRTEALARRDAQRRALERRRQLVVSEVDDLTHRSHLAAAQARAQAELAAARDAQRQAAREASGGLA